MNLLHDDDPRFKALRWKALGFLFAALFGAIAASVLFAWQQGEFEPKTPLTFVSDTGTDLRVGMAVKFSGFTIGSVQKMLLDDRGRVRISVLIENRYLKWIKADSVGRVGKEGLIGDAYIDVGVGNPHMPPVEADAELEFVPARSMDDIVRELHDRAMPIINDAAEQTRRLNDPNGDLNRTLANLRVFSDGLKTTQAKLDATLDHVNQLAAADVPETLASTRTALQRADAALQRADASLQIVEQRLPGLLDRTDRVLTSVEATSRASRQLIEGISPDAIGAAQEARTLVRKGNEAADGAMRSWPLKAMVQPHSVTPQRSDSQGAPP